MILASQVDIINKTLEDALATTTSPKDRLAIAKYINELVDDLTPKCLRGSSKNMSAREILTDPVEIYAESRRWNWIASLRQTLIKKKHYNWDSGKSKNPKRIPKQKAGYFMPEKALAMQDERRGAIFVITWLSRITYDEYCQGRSVSWDSNTSS